MLYEIEQSGFADNLRSGIVVTGGGANLTNCANYIKELSGYNVRHGYPKHQLVSHLGCDAIRETNAAVSLGLILAAKTDRIPDCVLGEAMVSVGETVTFGKNGAAGSGEENRDGGIAHEAGVPEQDREDKEPIQETNPELFAKGEIEQKSQEELDEEKEQKKKEKAEEKKRRDEEKKKKPNVIWTNIDKFYRKLFEDDNEV